MTAAALRARVPCVVRRALYHLPVRPEQVPAAELRALRRTARVPLAGLRAEQWCLLAAAEAPR